MAYSNENYKPYKKSKMILDTAMNHILSVDYKVSVRWVFYRLLQEGLYNTKDNYTDFIKLSSRARHSYYGNWNPLTLADETRDMIIFDDFGRSPYVDIESQIDYGIEAAKEEISDLRDSLDNYSYSCIYSVDPNYHQDTICIILFEARAMSQQFQAYTSDIPLCPFGGQPSIPYKYNIAQYIQRQCNQYDKDCTVLYFGDLDEGGKNIYKAGKEDITKWCNADIEFIKCGLTEKQVEKYDVPENLEHPNAFQWEALSDEHAKEIITNALKDNNYNFGAKAKADQETWEIRKKINTAVNEKLENE